MRFPALVLAASCLFSTASAARAAEELAPQWRAKVDPLVLAQIGKGGATEVLVVLGEQADLTAARALHGRRAKGEAVVAALRATAERTQAPLRAWLAARGIAHRPFWVTNMIWARTDAVRIAELASRPEVRRLEANPSVRVELPALRQVSAKAQAGVEWGVARVGAPAVWNAGVDGSGIVIGGQDSGYDWSHEALRDRYRGWNGTAAEHDYNWHDAIHDAAGNPCGVDTPAPCDDGSHGTHTMGTMVGRAGDRQIGVAPGARWIGCRNMDRGAGTPARYAECFQWFLAPTDTSGAHPDARRAPDVINNSWGCPRTEGCTEPDVLRAVVENVRAAGIVVVVSAGNSGPRCGTVKDPAAIYDAVFSVGATNSGESIAGFSSRGPVTIDGSQRLKPDIAAPGVDVLSSVPGGGYAEFSGTSMAGPHVAGVVALLLQARPELDGNVEAIERVLRETAVPIATAEDCGATAGLVPNNVFGAGRIDAWAAVNSTGGTGGFLDEFEDGVRPSGWKFRGASWREQGGALTASGGEAWAQKAFGGCATCSVEATLSVAAGRGGSASLVGWRRDAQHYVELRLLESEDRWLLVHRDGKRNVQASFAAPLAPNVDYAVRIAFDGERFTVAIDGLPAFELAKAAGSSPTGTVGLRVSKRAARFSRLAAG